MKLRKDDNIVVSVLFGVIFLTAMVESWIIFGAFIEHGHSYFLHAIFGWFVTLNALGNLIFCHFVDNSVVDSNAWKSVHKFQNEVSDKPENWRFCEQCQILTPPRSWHCKVCEKCILKRDHHCIMTGRCVGHNNYRYFLIMLFYGTIGSAYGLYLNYFYMVHIESESFSGFFSKICFVNPMFIMFQFTWDDHGIHYKWPHILIPFLHILIAMFIGSVALLITHSTKCLIGATCHEGRSTRYNLGSMVKNLKAILGERYILVWFLPFIKSKLPYDGVHWEPTNIKVSKM